MHPLIRRVSIPQTAVNAAVGGIEEQHVIARPAVERVGAPAAGQHVRRAVADEAVVEFVARAVLKDAEDNVRRAPLQIRTPFRAAFEEHFG